MASSRPDQQDPTSERPQPAQQPSAATGEQPRGRLELALSPFAARVVTTLALLAVLAYGGWRGYQYLRGPALPVIAYSELLPAIDAGRVASITVRPGEDVRGRWSASGAEAGHEFTVAYPVETVDGLTQHAQANGVAITLAPPPSHTRVRDVASTVLLVLMAL